MRARFEQHFSAHRMARGVGVPGVPRSVLLGKPCAPALLVTAVSQLLKTGGSQLRANGSDQLSTTTTTCTSQPCAMGVLVMLPFI